MKQTQYNFFPELYNFHGLFLKKHILLTSVSGWYIKVSIPFLIIDFLKNTEF